MSDLDIIRTVGTAVADRVRELFPLGGGGEHVRMGADGTWTNMIDQEAESAAFRAIEEMGLDWNIISEEAGHLDRSAEKTLVIDPIDGSYNAENGLPFFSTSIAVMGPQGEIDAGMVLNIPTGRCYYAEKGGGAFLDGSLIHTREFIPSEAAFSSFLEPGSIMKNRDLLSWPRRIRYFGCISLEVCLVAKGALDLFALFSRVPRITDIAAGYLVLKEAGGQLIRIMNDGTWAPCHPGDGGANDGIAAVGDPRASQSLVDMCNMTAPMKGVP